MIVAVRATGRRRFQPTADPAWAPVTPFPDSPAPRRLAPFIQRALSYIRHHEYARDAIRGIQKRQSPEYHMHAVPAL